MAGFDVYMGWDELWDGWDWEWDREWDFRDVARSTEYSNWEFDKLKTK